jgi:hypothetical protein
MSPTVYPKKIFIESSLLFQLGPRLENVEFAHLLEVGQSVKCQPYVSEVSWLEYLRERKRELTKLLDSSLAAQKALDKHGKSIPEFADAFQKTNSYIKNIDLHFRSRAQQRGIEIIPLPKIDIARLLAMCIDCTPPFEEPDSRTKEKGFRDSLIMFSILENIRGRPEDNALIITNDRLLARAFELHAEEFQTRLRIATTFDEATALISEAISEAERSRLKREMEGSIEMLMRYKDEITSKIEQVKELTDWDLGQNQLSSFFYGDFKGNYVDIRGVESVSFDGISSAVWKERDTAASRILFSCRCTANAVVYAPHLRVFSDTSRSHRVGQPSSQSWATYALNSFDSGPTEKKSLHFQMYGEAQLIRDGKEWRLQALRIDKSPPSEEELNTLVEARNSAFGSQQPS